MRRMLSLCDIIDRLLRAIGNASGILFILLMVTIVFDVTTRGRGWTNSTQLQELEWHFHTAICFLVFAYTMTLDKHVRVEVFRERWQPKTKAVVDILGLLFLFLPLCAVALYYSYFFALHSFLGGEASASATGLSHRWIIKSFQPLAFVLLLLAGFSAFVRNVAVLQEVLPEDRTAESSKREDISPTGI